MELVNISFGGNWYIGENGKVLGTKVYFWLKRVTSVVDRLHNIILFIKLNIPVDENKMLILKAHQLECYKIIITDY